MRGLSSTLQTHVQHDVAAIRPFSRLIRPSQASPVATLPPRNLKLNRSTTTNYPSLKAWLIQAIKDNNEGKPIARQRNMLWVEEGQGEVSNAGPLQDD